MPKESAFNEYFKEPVIMHDGDYLSCAIISAELYSVEEAAGRFADDFGVPVESDALAIGYVRFQGGQDNWHAWVNTWWLVDDTKGARRVWMLDWAVLKKLSNGCVEARHD